MREETVGIEAFDIGLESLVGHLDKEVELRMPKAITKVSRYGAKKLREEAGKRWSGKTGSTYSAGFTSHVESRGHLTTGEVGNKNFPGLVHLLEKGHDTLAGRRTRAYPHVAPVYDEMVPKLIEEVGAGVDEALEG